MNGWILNIVGVVFVGVIVEMVLPNGKINGFIKHVFAIFVLFVIISPLQNYFSGEYDLSSLQIEVDYDFIYKTNQEKVEALQNSIIAYLSEQGIVNAGVIIDAYTFSESLNISKVYVDLTNCNLVNIKNVNQLAIDSVLKFISVNEEDIVVYE